MKRNVSLLFLMLLLILITGCFRDVLSWSSDGRYLSYIEPKGRLWIWDSKTEQSAVAIPTTGTATAAFLPKRWFEGEELLVAKGTGGGGQISNLGILRMKSGAQDSMTTHTDLGNYDIATKGWVYYIVGQKEAAKQYALWGYDVRKGNRKLIYESNTEMVFPSSDGSGHILVGAAGKDIPTGKDLPVIMEIDADSGTTRSLASLNATFWFPMWGGNKKSVLYLEMKDQSDTTTLCMIDLETKTTESLMTSVTPVCRVQITKDRKWAVATVATSKNSSAVARVNLQGKHVVEYLTPKDGEALYGTLSPDGNRLAYCVGDAEHYKKIVVKDLKSGVEKVVWQGK